MKRKMIAGICLGAAAVLLLGTAGIYAFREVTATYQAGTGKVDIELEERMMADGEEKPWIMEEQVLPGQTLSRIARIRNQAADCYVRALITFSDRTGVEEGLTDQNLLGMSGDWIKKGSYFYYQKPLEENASVEIFTGIQVPTEWDTRYDTEQQIQPYYTDNTWDLQVKVDAIQSKNFIPDFSSETPWGIEGQDYQIEVAKEGEPAVYTAIPGNFSVDFEGDSAELIADSQNFTDDLELFLPGDSQRKMMELKNTSGSTKSLYMKAACLSEDPWMDQMELQLILQKEGVETVVYQGSVAADTLGDAQRLCTLAPGETGVLQAIFTMPKELGNEFSLREGAIQFAFSTEANLDMGTPVSQRPKTGDPISWGMIALLLLSGTGSAVGAVVLLKKRRQYDPSCE